MLDETNLIQRLGAEAIGTAFLVFIGVGSVPATLIVNGDAPFTMADLGMISLAFGTIVVATVYALGHIGGNHINPAVTLGLAASGKFPWSQVPGYIGAQVVGAIVGAAAIIGVLGMAASDVGLGVASYNDRHGGHRAGLHRRVRRHVHPGLHHLRRHPPQGRRRVRRRRDRPGRLRRDHPGRARPPARRSTRPAPSARCSSSRSPVATSSGRQLPGLPGRRARSPASLAALLYGLLTRTPADRQAAEPRAWTSGPPTSSRAPTSPNSSHHRDPGRTPMKKLINDPNDVVTEALLGIEAAHPGLQVDHHNKVIYRGDTPKQGKVGHHLRRRLGPRAAARRVRRARHARRRLRRRDVHLAGARPDAGGHQAGRRRRRRPARREELHRRRDELRDGGRAGRRARPAPASSRWSPTTTWPSRTAPGRPVAAASASPCCSRRSPARRPSRVVTSTRSPRWRAPSTRTAAAWASR